MAGTTKTYNAAKIMNTVGDVWVGVAVPASGSRLTLDNATGTPDSTANPNAKHLGLTESGTVVKITAEVQSFEADELTSPWKQNLTGEKATMSGKYLQIEDWTILGLITPGGTKTTGSGYEQLTFGGLTTVTTNSVAVIGASAETGGKWVVFQLYAAFNSSGIETQLTRKDFSKVPFEFTGNSIATRPQGDQVGSFWRQV
jgi:hypothetical protein